MLTKIKVILSVITVATFIIAVYMLKDEIFSSYREKVQVNSSDIEVINKYLYPLRFPKSCHQFLRTNNYSADEESIQVKLTTPNESLVLQSKLKMESINLDNFYITDVKQFNELTLGNLVLELRSNENKELLMLKRFPIYYQIEKLQIKQCGVLLPTKIF